MRSALRALESDSKDPTAPEYESILEILGREPNIVELGIVVRVLDEKQ